MRKEAYCDIPSTGRGLYLDCADSCDLCVCPPWHQRNSSSGYALIWPSEHADMDEALVKAREAQGGHTSGHTRNAPTVGEMKAPAKLQ
jgi:hypothetical protein